MKNAEIEEIRKKAKQRKDKVRMLKRENITLKNAIRDIEIKSTGPPSHQQPLRRGSALVSDDERNSHVSRITKNDNENEIPHYSGYTSMKNPLSPTSNSSPPRVQYVNRNRE